MFRSHARTLGIVALLALLAGCGGRGTSSSVVHTPKQGETSHTKVAMNIVIKAKPPSAYRRVPKHLPSSTSSLQVLVNSGSPQVFDVSATSANCTPAGGGRTCSLTVDAPIGADTFDLTTFDAPSATGNRLSHGAVSTTISFGTNNIGIALGGVVATLALSPAALIYEGAPTTTAQANAVAKDADGNTIVGPYDDTITVTGSGSFAASGTLAQSSDTVTLSYDGADPANVGPGTFSAATAGSVAIPTTTTPGFVSNPKTLATGVALWYDAADASSISAGMSSFSWSDKSGHGNTASNGTLSPTYPGAVTMNGHHGVEFTPSQFLTSAAGFPSGNYTLFVVAANTAADGPSTFHTGTLVGSTGTTTGHALFLSDPGTLCVPDEGASSGGCVAVVTAPDPGTGPTLAAVSYRVTVIAGGTNGTNVSLSLNGATSGGGFAAATQAGRGGDASVVINGYGTSGSSSSTNTIAEVVVLDHDASALAGEQTAVEAYLKAKWGLGV